MLPKLLKWTQEQKEFIEALPGKANEHIRRAIDNYIQKIKDQQRTASTSSSKRKEIK